MATTPDLTEAMSLPPDKAIAWFRQKGYTISWDWQDTLSEAHARAFTVARVTQLDTLQTIRGAVDQAIAEGKTERWFEQTLTPKLQQAGWWGKTEEVVQATGEIRQIQLGSPDRLKLIFRQNVQSAYMAGRWADIVAVSDKRPYLQYIAIRDLKTRPTHASLNRRVFRFDDPIWLTLWPPNGWGCRCRVRSLSEAQVRRMGLTVESSEGMLRTRRVQIGTDYEHDRNLYAEVTGIRTTSMDGRDITFYPDAGFSYNPGRSGWSPELDKYAPDVARKYVDGVVTGPEFERWFGIWSQAVDDVADGLGNAAAREAARKLARERPAVRQAADRAGLRTLPGGAEYPVGILKPADMTALGSASQTVLMSSNTLIEHLAAHPDIQLQDYQQLPRIIDEAAVYEDGDRHILLLADGDRMYQAVVKTDAQRDRLYLLTLHATTKQKADADVRRLKRVR